MNLKAAWTQFEKEIKAETVTNLASASAGLAAATLDFMQAAAEVNLSLRTTKILEGGGVKGTVNRLMSKILSGAAARFFGYFGAFLTAITDAIKAVKQMMQGQWEAGLYYAASGLTAGFGGGAITAAGGLLLASNPIGWLVLVAGILLVGISVLCAMAAENAIAQPLEKWLDSGVFGKHKLDGATEYAGLKEEQEALVAAMYTPVVLESDFDIYHNYDYGDTRVMNDAYTSEFKLLLPGYQPGESNLQITHNAPGQVSDWGANAGSQYSHGGALIHYRHFIPKDKFSTWKVEYTVKYRPNKDFEKDLILNFNVEHAAHLGVFD